MLFIVPSKQAHAASGGSVYASVEKFTLGQGYLVSPTEVKFKEGENYANILDRVLKANGYTYDASMTSQGFYLVSIDNADNRHINVSKCIQNMPGKNMPANKVTTGNPYPNNGLGQFSYSQQSGWYYFVNNMAPQVGMDSLKVQNGDVVRFQFTLYAYGGDLGNEQYEGVPVLKLPNRDSITKKLAIVKQHPEYKQNPVWVNAYNQAIAIASNMDSTQGQITAAQNALPSENQIAAWVKAKQQKQLEEMQKVLMKKNTPAKTTLKSIKKSGKNKAHLAWEKVSKATGYEIYQSIKGGRDYKKIKTIKKNKVVTYKTKTLKTKKTYYFKIRTYRKVSGKVYYGGFSKIKKIKIK